MPTNASELLDPDNFLSRGALAEPAADSALVYTELLGQLGLGGFFELHEAIMHIRHIVSMPNAHGSKRHNIAMPSGQSGSILDRIVEAASDKGLLTTQKAIGKVADVGQSSVSRWNDKNPPTLENALRMAKTYGVCVEWLYTGRGPKRPDELDPRLQDLLEAFRHLPEAIQDEVVSFVQYKRSTTFTGDPERLIRFQSSLPRHRTHQSRKRRREP